MTAPFRKTSRSSLLCCLVAMLIVFTLAASVPANAVPPAAFTTFDKTTGGCLDGAHPNGIDCNNYAAKEDVYVNGGPGGLGGLSNGSYYFVVLVPGFQNGGFIDGASGNLSDVTASNDSKSDPSEVGAGSGDDVSNRTFTVGGGVATYTGTHALGTDPKGDSVIQLMPYDDTTNMGGVYILGICQTGATSDSQCKFDAFRIKKTTTTCVGDACAATGTVDVCKFWDQNFDHMWDNDEPFIGAWPISATITGGDGATLDAPSKNTDNTVVANAPGPGFGCTTFTVTFPASDSPSATVTFTEGNAPVSVDPVSQACNFSAQTCSATPAATWTQSAPWDFANKVLLADTATVSPNQDVQADNFGNFYGQDLTVSKSATPTFTRTYVWSILKSASPAEVDQSKLTPQATFNYSVAVSETGVTDSAWQVTGTITVTNPNGFDVSGVTVTDTVNDGGNCNVTGGTGVTVPANSSVQLSYTCTYSSAPTPPLVGDINTAEADWTANAFGTPDGSATGTATFNFNTPTTTVNKTITPQDSFNGGTAVNLCTLAGGSSPCTLTATDPPTAFTTYTYKYTRTINIPNHGCATYPNTASILETGQTSNASVKVCRVAEKTGALTMGFWQNKNGQAIITNYCGGTSGTSLHAFLTFYHPFSDETSTTCSGEATYVYNVIKVATCTSTSKTCNSMLKAQMLATALDVYFSASSLGGNRIGAPSAIGADLIDLTQICRMIDGTGGTATCSGTYENVSSAFGGATSLSVSAMLLYQNTADPTPDAGANWYGQVKATQVLAKDAFDAINNGVAFAP